MIKRETIIAKGNQEADLAGKKAAGYTAQHMMLQTEKTVYDLLPACDENMLIKQLLTS